MRDTDSRTKGAVVRSSAWLVERVERGYRGALLAGFGAAGGRRVLTMDADLPHPPTFIGALWATSRGAEIVIASRYVAGGRAEMSPLRYLLSRVLNAVFSRGVGLPIRDMSSGFRLYDAAALCGESFRGRDFDILQEILVSAYCDGYTVREAAVPLRDAQLPTLPRASVLRFGIAYLRSFWRLWKLRNSIAAADYDDRAYDSPIFLQRYWQRSRVRHLRELTTGEGAVLDVRRASRCPFATSPSAAWCARR